MKRLLYDVSRWHLFLHRDTRGLPPAQPDDDALLMLQDELFDRLYGGQCEVLPPEKQDTPHGDWAKALHTTFESLPTFTRLADQCRGNALAASAAVEALLDRLSPELPHPASLSASPELRRQLTRATAQATEAADVLAEAEAGLEHVGLNPAAGQMPGTGTPQENQASRSLASRLLRDERLRRIALLGGRFTRILAAKRRSTVRTGADAIADIQLGANLARLLPAELARLGHPRQRLSFLRDFSEGRCLEYQYTAREALGKGPLVVCLDKSDSMDGEKDTWATAVALALLDVAQRERRPFGLVGFDAAVRYRTVVPPGGKLPDEGLFVSCNGGTDIATALFQALDIISERPGRLRKADIVLITDGESSLERTQELRARAAALDVSILGFGIGVQPSKLQPWCDDTVSVESLGNLDDGSTTALSQL